MNHHHRISDDARAEREARVLAVVLGMASTDEIAAVEQLLRDDPELRAYRDELIETLPTLQEALKASADSPDLRMDEARRAVLLGKLRGSKIHSEGEKEIKPIGQPVLKEAATNIVPWPVLFRQNIVAIAACAVFAAAGVFVALPAFMSDGRSFVAEAEYDIPPMVVELKGDSSNLEEVTRGVASYSRKSSEMRSSGYTSGGSMAGTSIMQSHEESFFDSDSKSVADAVSRSDFNDASISAKQKSARLYQPVPLPATVPPLESQRDLGEAFSENGRALTKRELNVSGGSIWATSGSISPASAPAQGQIVATPSMSYSAGKQAGEIIAADIPAKAPSFSQERGRVVMDEASLFSESSSMGIGVGRGGGRPLQKEGKSQSEEQMTGTAGSPKPRRNDSSASDSGRLVPLKDAFGSDSGFLYKDAVANKPAQTLGGLERKSESLVRNESNYAGTITLDLNGKLGYESEYIYRGKEHAPELGDAKNGVRTEEVFAIPMEVDGPVSRSIISEENTPQSLGLRERQNVKNAVKDESSPFGSGGGAGSLSSKPDSQGGEVSKRDRLTSVDDAWRLSGVSDKDSSIAAASASDPASDRLKKTIIPTVTFRDAPLSKVIETISELSVIYDPGQKGVDMVVIDPEQKDPKVNLTMRNVSLDRLLEVATKSANFDYQLNNGIAEIRPNFGSAENETAIIPIPMGPMVKITGMAAAGDSDSGHAFGSTADSSERPEEIAIKRFLQREGIPFDVPGSALAFDGTNLIVTQSRHNLEKIKGILAAYAKEEAKATEKAETPALRLVYTSASENAFSTFSLNVSDVSFRLAAEALSQGRWPDKDSLRTEEFVNAVKYNDPPPAQNEAVSLTQEQARHPFAHNRDLLRLSVQTASAGRNSRQPLNLTVLLDTSGSMTRADRQEIVEVALQALADNLSPNDTVSVIGFSRNPRLLVDRVNGIIGAEQLRVLAGRIPPEGGTNLELALQAAYEKSRSVQVPGVQSTIVLLTDGAANLGDAKPENLARIIAQNKKLGIGLNCYGIGFDGYNDAMLETLARSGNGRYAYLSNADEARNDFAAKLAGALQVAAQNVKVQVEFNPARVGAYRLMGYEKHRLKKEEFRDNSVAAAELGAAESGTAVYSVEAKPDGTGDIGVVRVRYQDPATGDYKEREWNIPYSPAVPAFDDAAPGVQLAATAALLAEKLEGTEEAQAVSLSSLAKYLKKANNSLGAFPENRKLQSMLETAARLE